MSIQPAHRNLSITRGATFRQRYTLLSGQTKQSATPKDLTNFTGEFKVMRGTTTLLTLTDGSGLTLGGVEGTIDLYLSNTDTSNLTWSAATYTLAIIDGSNSDKNFILYGSIQVKRLS